MSYATRELLEQANAGEILISLSGAFFVDGDLCTRMTSPPIRAWEIEVGDRAWRMARSTMYPAEVTYQHLLAQFELCGHDIPEHLRRHTPTVTRIPTVIPGKRQKPSKPRAPRLEDTFSL